jgi:lysophospholipase L1-like esterase
MEWPMSSWSDLLIIGDSITLGAAEVRGTQVLHYVEPTCIDLLRAGLPMLDIRVDAQVSRNSVSVRQEIESLIAAHQPLDRVLLMIGGSDADMDWKRFVLSEGRIARSRVPVDRYEKNIRQICERLIAIGATPILTDMPNHDFKLKGPYVSQLSGKDVVAMIDAGGGQAESDKHLVEYRASIVAIAADLGVQLIPFGAALDSYPSGAMLSPDGTHPNAAGHCVIAQCMMAVLGEQVPMALKL